MTSLKSGFTTAKSEREGGAGGEESGGSSLGRDRGSVPGRGAVGGTTGGGENWRGPSAGLLLCAPLVSLKRYFASFQGWTRPWAHACCMGTLKYRALPAGLPQAPVRCGQPASGRLFGHHRRHHLLPPRHHPPPHADEGPGEGGGPQGMCQQRSESGQGRM